MSSNLDNILNKIRKLSRLAESNNAHEAALAAETMARMMQEHQISEAMLGVPVEAQEKVTNDFTLNKGKKNIATWMSHIAHGVCLSVGSKLYYLGGDFKLIGRKSDNEAASYMFHAIINQVKDLADKHWENEGQYQGVHGKSWKNSFYLGAASTIYDRLKNQKESMMADLKRDSSKSMALTVFNQKEYEIDKLREAMKLRKKNVSYNVNSMTAYQSGSLAGHNVNLGGNKALGKPNKMIGSQGY